MATPAEVIAQQHEEARQLLSIMPCGEPPSRAEIPRSMKTCPTIDLFGDDGSEEKKAPMDEDAPNIVSWSSRGRVDVSKLQALVKEGYRIADHTPTKKQEASPKKTTTTKTCFGF